MTASSQVESGPNSVPSGLGLGSDRDVEIEDPRPQGGRIVLHDALGRHEETDSSTIPSRIRPEWPAA